jgi:nucleoside-diphosphate-sugar epimerase
VEMEKEFLGRLPSITIMRFAGLIGPGRHPARFLAGRKNVPSPDAAVNLIHLDDCIGVIRSLLETRAEGIFNACTPDHPPRREYYTEACRRLGIEPPVFTPGDSSAGREISTVKLIEETGYHYRHNDLYAALEHCLLPGPQNGL